MVDVEFRVVSDRREGLLLALGQTVIANGFTLLRQRMGGCEEGVLLTLLVRGPEENLLLLEERLGTHHLVRSFESGPADTTQAPATPAASPPARALSAAPSTPRPAESPSIATHRVETTLPQLARNYPSITILLQALQHELPPAQREPTMTHVGQRVGTWVYKRDYALGGRLPLPDALRRIALPALRQLVRVEQDGEALVVANSPFCHHGETGACCHFLRGMLEGLLGGPHGIAGLMVAERECRNHGATACRFEFTA
jgi:predicted hydrocarbon binding protein